MSDRKDDSGAGTTEKKLQKHITYIRICHELPSLGEQLLTQACSYKTGENGFKLEEDRIKLGTRKKFLTVRMVRHWNRTAQKACGCPIAGGI